jgi:trehalose 6-phosphate phosphatase
MIYDFTSSQFRAVILDLDGVITQTAQLHAHAWKKMFDEYLQKRSSQQQEPFKPMDIEADYAKHIDGIPRYEGVRNFLQSRNINLPEGSLDDAPSKETICGLGNRKNEIFRDLIKNENVQVYDDTIEQIKHWKKAGIKVAVISASKNCTTILKATKLLDLFDAKIDGLDAEEKHLQGKPEPDIFITAARQLGARPMQSVVVEDAQMGVYAGNAGGFALVVGVDRSKNTSKELKEHGAHIVVNNLKELKLV